MYILLLFMESGEKNVALFLRLDKLIFAVREAGVSWHDGGPIKGPHLSSLIRQCCDVRGASEDPQLGPDDAERL